MMNINQLRKFAGLPQRNDDVAMLTEDVEIPEGSTHDQLMKMLDGAKKAMSIAHKIKDKEQRKKHFSRIFKGLNKIRNHAVKLSKEDAHKADNALASMKRLQTTLKSQRTEKKD